MDNISDLYNEYTIYKKLIIINNKKYNNIHQSSMLKSLLINKLINRMIYYETLKLPRILFYQHMSKILR